MFLFADMYVAVSRLSQARAPEIPAFWRKNCWHD
jgi:hypothetical protein